MILISVKRKEKITAELYALSDTAALEYPGTTSLESIQEEMPSQYSITGTLEYNITGIHSGHSRAIQGESGTSIELCPCARAVVTLAVRSERVSSQRLR